ncbi:MAG: dUTP diphosphatase [Candidatus Paceibacterota bacterium]
MIQIKRLDKDVPLPSYAHGDDAGFDLFAREEIVVPASGRAQIPSGIALAIPEGSVGLIWDKSGLSHKAGLKVLGGVVDAGYRGEVLVGIANLTDTPHTFSKGDKIAQMLIQKVEHVSFKEVDELDETERGEGGFGSTGK